MTIGRANGDGYAARYSTALMNTFGPPQRILVRGEGSRVWDADGREYLDLLAGIAVNALGHAHPAVVGAVHDQMMTLGHISNFFASPPQIGLAERLLRLLGGDDAADDAGGDGDGGGGSATVPGRVFFTNSGTEANEAALKMTRRTGRTHLVAMDGAFHGRTMGALALTSKASYREPFEPLPGEVTFVPYGDVDALAAAVTDQTAAVVVEPILGEAGVIPAPPGYLAAVRRITTERGALLWLDEIQTGIGRTGRWFAHHGHLGHLSATDGPDIVTVAKGLGGGFPIGAAIGLGGAADLLQPGNHGTTFGGNPVACAAALAVIATIESEGLLAHVHTMGERLRVGLSADSRVVDVRGEGLLIGLDLDRAAGAAVGRAALAAGFIVNAPTPTGIRIAPPFTLTGAEADRFIAAWPAILDEAYRG